MISKKIECKKAASSVHENWQKDKQKIEQYCRERNLNFKDFED